MTRHYRGSFHCGTVRFLKELIYPFLEADFFDGNNLIREVTNCASGQSRFVCSANQIKSHAFAFAHGFLQINCFHFVVFHQGLAVDQNSAHI